MAGFFPVIIFNLHERRSSEAAALGIPRRHVATPFVKRQRDSLSLVIGIFSALLSVLWAPEQKEVSRARALKSGARTEVRPFA